MPAPEEAKDLEILRGRVVLSIEALKSLLLVNGGAAIGLLTFLGNVNKDGTGFDVANVRWSLLAFSGGAAMALVGFLYAYVAQARLHEEILEPDVPSTHGRWVFWGAVSAFASVVLFGLGAAFGAFGVLPAR